MHPLPRWRGTFRCEFERTLKGEYCGQEGQLRLDGLLLCVTHTRQLILEERVAYWRAMLAHIEVWSREARTRGREDIVDLLGIERLKTSAALEGVWQTANPRPGLGKYCPACIRNNPGKKSHHSLLTGLRLAKPSKLEERTFESVCENWLVVPKLGKESPCGDFNCTEQRLRI